MIDVVHRPPLSAGIFAAGMGSRLGLRDGAPKALLPVGGRPLIDWTLRELEAAGVADVVIIVNDRATAVRDHVSREFASLAVTWIVETTPSSMHSFLRVMERLAADGGEGPFLMTTVDTIAPPGTFRAFAGAAARPPADLVLALTSRVDDDNPLRVETDQDGKILAFGAGNRATAGYSLARASLLREAAAGRAANFTALRAFFGHLLARGYSCRGITVAESVDVDRPADVEAAERLLQACAR